MNVPQCSTDGDSWRYRWEEEGWEIGFERLKESGDSLKADCWISAIDEQGQSGHVIWEIFNLQSAQTRQKLASSVAHRTQTNSNMWTDMLEYSCVRTCREWRVGEPVHDLSKGEAVTQVEYDLFPLLPARQIVSLCADGDSCKSMVGLAICISLETCLPIIPGLEPKRRLRTLYLDWETSLEEMTRRAQMLANGAGQPRPPALYRHMTRPLAEEISTIKRIVTDNRVGFVVVDSAGPAAGGELTESGPAIGMMSAIRRLDISSLVIGHVSKNTASDTTSTRGRMYGSVFFENLARSAWELRSDTTMSPLSIGFFQRKANMGKKSKPFAVNLRFDDGRGTAVFSAAHIGAIPDIARHAPLPQRIVAALASGARDAIGLAEDIGVTDRQVRDAANELVKSGALVLLSSTTGNGGRGLRNVYGLAAQSPNGRSEGILSIVG